MAIEPIKGFYVHDEATDTDVVAKVDYDNGLYNAFAAPINFTTRSGLINANLEHADASDSHQEVYTNKIPVEPGDIIEITFDFSNITATWIWAVWAFCDKDGRPINRVEGYPNTTSYIKRITIPTNCYYIVFSYWTNGALTASIRYRGQIAKIATGERVAKGYAFNANGWDVGTPNADDMANSVSVLRFGYRPVTDFIPATFGYAYFYQHEDYTAETYAYVQEFDYQKRYIGYKNWQRVDWYPNINLDANTKFIRVFFDGANQPNNNTSPTVETIKKYIEIVTDAKETLCPLIGGYGYPSLNTTAKTLTFPKDLIIVANGKGVPLNSSAETVVNLSSVWSENASTRKIYFNPVKKTFHTTDYSSMRNPKECVLICVIRGPWNGRTATLDIESPHYIDGVLYGAPSVEKWALSPNVRGVGHAGCSKGPENTLPAFKLARDMGFEYVECDVAMTSDRVPVLLHDQTINRTARNADGSTISETINIGDITYEQALEYDFGIYKGTQFADTKIPTLQEFLTLCRNVGLKPYIELKWHNALTQTDYNNIVGMVKRAGLLEETTFVSFESYYLEQIANVEPSVRLGFVAETLTSADIETASALKTSQNKVFLSVSGLPSSLIDSCIENDLPVEMWTLDTESDILALDPYVSGVTSNNLVAPKVLYCGNI